MYTFVAPFDDMDDVLHTFLSELIDAIGALKRESIAKRIQKAGSFPSATEVKAALGNESEPKVEFTALVSESDGATLGSGGILLSEALLKKGEADKARVKRGGGVDPNGPVVGCQLALCFGLVLWGKQRNDPSAYDEAGLRTSFYVAHKKKGLYNAVWG